jgi:hypothetical protein
MCEPFETALIEGMFTTCSKDANNKSWDVRNVGNKHSSRKDINSSKDGGNSRDFNQRRDSLEVNSSKNNNNVRDASNSKDPYNSWDLGLSELLLEVPSSSVQSF